MTVTLMKSFLISFTLRNEEDNHFYQINNKNDQAKTDKYVVQTRSQANSSGIKVPEIHGINKGLNRHVKPGKQRPLPSLPMHSLPPMPTVQHVDKGQLIHPIPEPRIGQGRAGLRRKVKTNLPMPLSKPTPSQPITTHVPKVALSLPEPIAQSQVNVQPQYLIPMPLPQSQLVDPTCIIQPIGSKIQHRPS